MESITSDKAKKSALRDAPEQPKAAGAGQQDDSPSVAGTFNINQFDNDELSLPKGKLFKSI